MTAPRCLIAPWHDCAEPIDVTHAMVGAVAHELWKHTGGNATLNWLEAEAFVHDLLRQCKDQSPVDTIPLHNARMGQSSTHASINEQHAGPHEHRRAA